VKVAEGQRIFSYSAKNIESPGVHKHAHLSLASFYKAQGIISTHDTDRAYKITGLFNCALLMSCFYQLLILNYIDCLLEREVMITAF
jgi:hypothetical protein